MAEPSTILEKSLHDAACNGDVDVIKSAIEDGSVHVNAIIKDHYGWTMLHYAASNGHDDVISYLLSIGADPNIQDTDGETSLYTSCESNEANSVQLLLEGGAHPDIANEDGKTPLYIACYKGHDKVVQLLLDHGVQVDTPDERGKTPLFVGSKKGDIEIVQVLVKANASIDLANKEGKTPLYIASKRGYIEIVQVLLNANANTDLANNRGKTPLYAASKNDSIENVKELLKANASADLTNRDVLTPLYIACYNGYDKVVQVLLDHGVQVDIPDKYGRTPLHGAHGNGKDDIVKLLTESGASNLEAVKIDTLLLKSAKEGDLEGVRDSLTKQANINIANEDGKTALYVAAAINRTDIALLLIESGCSVDIKDNDDDTALHYAAWENNVDLIRAIMDHTDWIDVKNKSGHTPLHDACSHCSVDAIKFLISSGRVDPMSKNNREQAPMELVPQDHKNRFEILKMFEPFQQSQADFPVESYSKVFMCGNTTSGKSSLTAVIMERAKKPVNHKFDTTECVTVEPLTAGINPHTFISHEIGNVVLYDLAGHREYYSSHAAVLENLMLSSPAVFLILFKLINAIETMRKELYYWFNFIENVSKGMKSSKRSQIIVIGSRLDERTTSLDPISELVDEVVEKAAYSQEFCGFIPMECHRPGGKGVKNFIVTLSKSCKAVLDRSDKISFYCHVQYSFLQFLQRVAISLEELCALLRERNDPSLPSEMSMLLEFLTTLSDKGLILFLRNEEDQSWIVINRGALLTEINGVLFAPAAIKRVYRDMASNTGIVPLSALKEAFPHHNTDMLVGFLQSLQFCHIIESSTLNDLETNISTSVPLPLDEVLFFPALISAEPPTDMKIENGLGWCLWCPNPNEFLSTRFLHILLLCLAYFYCLPPRKKPGIVNVTNPAIQELARRCTVWTKGIYWKNKFEVVVEVSEHNRCVTVLTSNKEMEESRQVFNSVIKKVLSLKKQFCSCTSDEYMIAPNQVSTAHTLEVCKRTLYAIEDVAVAVLTKANVMGTDDTAIDVKEIVGNKDPFLLIAPLITKALFNASNAELSVQDDYLQHIQDVCSDTFLSSVNCTYNSIKEQCSSLSVFAGRNPMDVASPSLTNDDIECASKSLAKKTCQGSDISGMTTNLISSPSTVITPDTTYSSCPTTALEIMLGTHQLGATASSSTPSLRTSKDTADSSYLNTPVENTLAGEAVNSTTPFSKTSNDTTDSSYFNTAVESILDKEPKKVHLQRVLGPIQHKWREIGEALEIPNGTIKSIDHDARYNDSNKLSEVLQTWIDTQTSDVTWRNLIDVIKEYPVNEPGLAKTIPDFLANPKISSKY